MNRRAEDGSARGSPRRARRRRAPSARIFASSPVLVLAKTKTKTKTKANANAFVCDRSLPRWTSTCVRSSRTCGAPRSRRARHTGATPTAWTRARAPYVRRLRFTTRSFGKTAPRCFAACSRETRGARRRRSGICTGSARRTGTRPCPWRSGRSHPGAGTCLPETTRTTTKTRRVTRSRNRSRKRGSLDTPPSVGFSSRTSRKPPPTRKKASRTCRSTRCCTSSPGCRTTSRCPTCASGACARRTRGWARRTPRRTCTRTTPRTCCAKSPGTSWCDSSRLRAARRCTPKKKSRERLGQRVLAGGLRARRRRRVPGVRGSAKTRHSGGARAGRDAVHSARVVALRARARAEFLRQLLVLRASTL